MRKLRDQLRLRVNLMKRIAVLLSLLLALLCPASAQLTMSNVGGGFGAAAGGGIVFTPTDTQNALPAFASGSFTANIGTASADRIVIFGLVSDSNSLGTPTVNGSAATLAIGNCTTATQVCVYYANVTTGTTCTIGYGSGANGVAIVVGTLKGQSGGGVAAPTNTATYTAGGAQPLSLSLTVPAGGIGFVAAGFGFGTGGTPTYTWTGTTAGAGDETTMNASAMLGSAHSTSTGTITVSSTTSLSSGGTMAAASWAP